MQLESNKGFMTPQETFLLSAASAAKAAGHIFPEMAACEAALESAWGTSALAKQANNLFGEKAPTGCTNRISMQTREYLHSAWVMVPAWWTRFDTQAESFSARMGVLERLQKVYPDYGAALAAKTPEEYIVAVSRRWSTDPQRAQKVLEIYHAHGAIFQKLPTI